uniref:Flagellar hook-length control protein FliK n=1 Tax=Anaerolinea thermolimosa TaxID=229919 RepID=A0A7C4PT22_9CHLR
MVTPSPPLAVTPLDPAQRYDLAFKPFTRVTAEILHVSEAQAVLSVDGYPMVAQLTSPEQAAALRGQKTARFIVSQVSPQEVTMKLVSSAPLAADSAGQELAAHALGQFGLPEDPSNLTLARAILNQGLHVSADLFRSLRAALDGLGEWGETEAGLAAAMSAAGLPITPESLALMLRQQRSLAEGIPELVTRLRQLLMEKPIAGPLKEMLLSSLQFFEEVIVQWDAAPAELAARLGRAVQLLGPSLEFHLEAQVNSGSPFWPEKSLITLGRLQALLVENGHEEVAGAIKAFLDDLRPLQLLNSAENARHGETLQFLLHLPGGDEASESWFEARLHITRQSGRGAGTGHPGSTGLTVQVELETGRMMQVELMLVEKRIRAVITAPEAELAVTAEKELPSLQAGLEHLGYIFQEGQITVGTPEKIGQLPVTTPASKKLHAIDLEV